MKRSIMTIAKFAQAGGVGVETVRFYQRCGLLAIPKTNKTGYRTYSNELLQRLHFIRKAQLAGFTLKEIKKLLAFDPITDRAEIRSMAKTRLDKLILQIAELQQVSMSLNHLIQHCERATPDEHCPIALSFN
ncbi:MerR family transcriptional regulator [soil metagenome]